MSDTPDLEDPREDPWGPRQEVMAPVGSGSGDLGPGTQLALNKMSFIMTAQPVSVPRNLQKIRERMAYMCAASGESYYYSWMVNDKRANRKVEVSGPTIKLANDLAREYGNCFFGVVDVQENKTHWIFTSAFIDLENGFSTTRSFQQRKSQTAGEGMNAERMRDIAYQIGVSKSNRNVVVNALQTLADWCVEESRRALSKWVADNREKADRYIDEKMERFKLSAQQIEALRGRKRENWTNRDIAMTMTELRAIQDGEATVDELFPSPADAKKAEIAARGEEVKPEPEAKPTQEEAKPAADATPAGTDAGKSEPEKKGKRGRPKGSTNKKKKAEEKKPEPKPEPEPQQQEEASEPEPEGDEEEETNFDFDT